MKNSKFQTVEQVVSEAFQSEKEIRSLFREIVKRSPVKKQIIEKIAREIGEQALLTDEKSFLDFATRCGFSGIERTFFVNGDADDTIYKFEHLWGIEAQIESDKI